MKDYVGAESLVLCLGKHCCRAFVYTTSVVLSQLWVVREPILSANLVGGNPAHGSGLDPDGLEGPFQPKPMILCTHGLTW